MASWKKFIHHLLTTTICLGSNLEAICLIKVLVKAATGVELTNLKWFSLDQLNLQQYDHLTLPFDACVIHCKERVKSLGVLFHLILTFDLHVQEVLWVAFFYVRKIEKDLSNLVIEIKFRYDFVSSTLDYCKVIFYQGCLRKAAARSLMPLI